MLDQEVPKEYLEELLNQTRLANRTKNHSSEESKRKEATVIFNKLVAELNQRDQESMNEGQKVVYSKTFTTVRAAIEKSPARNTNFKIMKFDNATKTIPDDEALAAFNKAKDTLSAIYSY